MLLHSKQHFFWTAFFSPQTTPKDTNFFCTSFFRFSAFQKWHSRAPILTLQPLTTSSCCSSSVSSNSINGPPMAISNSLSEITLSLFWSMLCMNSRRSEGDAMSTSQTHRTRSTKSAKKNWQNGAFFDTFQAIFGTSIEIQWINWRNSLQMVWNETLTLATQQAKKKIAKNKASYRANRAKADHRTIPRALKSRRNRDRTAEKHLECLWLKSFREKKVDFKSTNFSSFQ